jgi:hypothetical protein
MATGILTTPNLGSTLHSNQANYRLHRAALFTLVSQADSWLTNPGRSNFLNSQIEALRLNFIRLHGNESGQPQN